MKKAASLFVMLILISSMFVIAESPEEECSWWCKFGKLFWGTGEKENIFVGGAWGGKERLPLVGMAAEPPKEVCVKGGAQCYKKDEVRNYNWGQVIYYKYKGKGGTFEEEDIESWVKMRVEGDSIQYAGMAKTFTDAQRDNFLTEPRAPRDPTKGVMQYTFEENYKSKGYSDVLSTTVVLTKKLEPVEVVEEAPTPVAAWVSPPEKQFGGELGQEQKITIDGEEHTIKLNRWYVGTGKENGGREGYLYPNSMVIKFDKDNDGVLSSAELKVGTEYTDCPACAEAARGLLAEHPGGVKALPLNEAAKKIASERELKDVGEKVIKVAPAEPAAETKPEAEPVVTLELEKARAEEERVAEEIRKAAQEAIAREAVVVPEKDLTIEAGKTTISDDNPELVKALTAIDPKYDPEKYKNNFADIKTDKGIPAKSKEEAALIQFQRDHNVEGGADGAAGTNTVGELNKKLKTKREEVRKPAEPAQPLPKPKEAPPLNEEQIKIAKEWGIDPAGMTAGDLTREIGKKQEAIDRLKAGEKPADADVTLLGLKDGENNLPDGTTVTVKDGKVKIKEPPREGPKGQLVPENAGWDGSTWKMGEITINDDYTIELPKGASPELEKANDAGTLELKEDAKGEGYLFDTETGDAWDAELDRDYENSKSYLEMWKVKWGNAGNFWYGNTAWQQFITKHIYGALRTMGGWRGMSSLIFADAEWYKDWLGMADTFFGSTLNIEGIANRYACQYDQRHSHDETGESSVFIETAAGTYQFVGAIQAEKSPSQTYILCNPTIDIPEEDRCPGELICEDELCYEDKDEDGEPDKEEPEKGYFYKAFWGVTAPQDEKFTPYVDEDGKAVKFNVALTSAESCDGIKRGQWFYHIDSKRGKEVIELSNGESDKGTILDYSQTEYGYACICFSDTYHPKDRDGEPVKKICARIKESIKGKVEFDLSDSEPSVTVQSGSVEGGSIW